MKMGTSLTNEEILKIENDMNGKIGVSNSDIQDEKYHYANVKEERAIQEQTTKMNFSIEVGLGEMKKMSEATSKGLSTQQFQVSINFIINDLIEEMVTYKVAERELDFDPNSVAFGNDISKRINMSRFKNLVSTGVKQRKKSLETIAQLTIELGPLREGIQTKFGVDIQSRESRNNAKKSLGNIVKNTNTVHTEYNTSTKFDPYDIPEPDFKPLDIGELIQEYNIAKTNYIIKHNEIIEAKKVKDSKINHFARK